MMTSSWSDILETLWRRRQVLHGMAMQQGRPVYFEDFTVGMVLETASYTMTPEAIVAFASAFDPQPFHLDPEAAKKSVFRTHVASGWHTAAVTMKLLVESGAYRETGLVGLGVDELRWPKPVFPGDVLRVRTEVVETIPSGSGKRGIVRRATTTLNQHGEVVMSMTSIALVPGRKSASL